MDVNQAFTLSGDWGNSALLLPELVNDGVRLLVYAGNAGKYFFFSPFLHFGTVLYRCASNGVDYVVSSSWIFMLFTVTCCYW
jgi:hypothetical protein